MGFSLFRVVLQSHRGAGHRQGGSGISLIGRRGRSTRALTGRLGGDEAGDPGGHSHQQKRLSALVKHGPGSAVCFCADPSRGSWSLGGGGATPVRAVRVQSLTCAGFPGWALGRGGVGDGRRESLRARAWGQGAEGQVGWRRITYSGEGTSSWGPRREMGEGCAPEAWGQGIC